MVQQAREAFIPVPAQAEAAEADLQLQAFQALLLDKGLHPRKSDRYMGSFSTALYEALQDTPELQEAYRETLSVKNSNQHHLWQVSARALIRQASEVAEEDPAVDLPVFPAHYLTEVRPTKRAKQKATDNWRSLIDWVVGDPERFGTFVGDIKNRNVQTNKFQRYVAIEAALHMFRIYDRLPEFPSILDIGCSQNHGNKVLASNLPFYGVTYSEECTPQAAGMVPYINQILKERIPKGRVDGVDMKPLKDSEDWARYNSFYLTELDERPELVKDYDAVSKINPDNVSFVLADFAKPHIETIPPNGLNPDGYDVATIVTVLHQLTPAERDQMFFNALAQLKPEGLLIVQDFFEPDGDSYGIVEDWDNKKGLYRTLVYDKMAPEKGFQELFVWKNPRCEELEHYNTVRFALETSEDN